MTRIHALRRSLLMLAGIAALGFGSVASADPPSRVARLGYTTGAVSFSPAGETDWVLATLNRPLTTGDRLWSDAGGRAEIQIGGTTVRMSAGTGVSVLNLDDQIAQLQLTQGALSVSVRRLDSRQVFEVDTPNLALTLRQPGEYRIEVERDGAATTIVMRRGRGEVYGDGAAFTIESRQQYRFTGTGLREYEGVAAPRVDQFDRWASDRDRAYDTSPSARYVSQDVVGYQDLDANGTWRVDASYGNVWTPTRVDAGWSPYRDGHWTWVDPWGWTWVDDAPWGFAVSHYGRWNNFGGTWGWVPGPVRTRAYYAPALVAFVGGNDFQLAISGGSVGGVAWFALGPRDVYRPSYQVSRGYFENVNRSNTMINTTVINNYYNNTSVTNVVYANRQVPGAVVAVPTTAFVQSQSVSRAAVRASKELIASGPVGFVPPVAPTVNSVRGAAAKGGDPPSHAFERPVVARSAPPAVRADFATQQPQLTAKPGKPLDDAARRELKPAATAPAPVVNVIAQEQKLPPIMRPPSPIAGKPTEAHGRSDERPPAMTAPLPQRSAQPVAVPAPRVAPTVAPPSPPQRANSESARPVKQNEPRTSVAEGKPQPAQAQPAPPAQAQPASTAEPRNQGRKPAAAKPGERKDADEQKREQDDQKPKR